MERPPSFQFYPRDFLADMQIHGIGVGLGGRYLWALCCSWMTDTPGVAAEEQWVAWMGLTGEQWISVREKMLACFKVGSDGKLVQKRMVEEREAQRLRHERSVMGGKLSAERRATKPAPLEGSTSTAPTPASASALDSKSTPLPEPPAADSGGRVPPCMIPKGGRHRKNRSKEPPGFAEWYAAYPKKVAPDDAAKAYAARLADGVEPADMARHLPVWCRFWSIEPTPWKEIPYPATFLNRGDWKSAPVIEAQRVEKPEVMRRLPSAAEVLANQQDGFQRADPEVARANLERLRQLTKGIS